MNADYQQLQLGNPFAPVRTRERFVNQRPYDLAEPLRVRNLADLQTGQEIPVTITHVTEPAAISQLRTLREDERDTEQPITPHAFSTATSLLMYAHVVLGEHLLPRVLVAPDGMGGIRMEWFRDNRNVRVVIPAQSNQEAYIYQRIGQESGIKPFSRPAVTQTLRSIIFNL